MARPASRMDDAQLPLAASVQSVHRANGERFRKLIQKAISANTLSLSDLADETGIDNSQITRMLGGDAGLRADFIAALLQRDRLGVVVQGLAAMCGYEATPKTPDLAAENKRLRSDLVRLRSELDTILEGA
jgi:transcriptional regulator with XRE-family HTH domain